MITINEFSEKIKLMNVYSLNRFNLTLCETHPATKVLGEYYQVTCSNNQYRSISLKFFYEAHENLVVGYVLNNKIQDTVGLFDLCKRFDIEQGPSLGHLNNYEGEKNHQLDACLKHIDSLLCNTKLSDILSSKHWEDIAFDWGGMR